MTPTRKFRVEKRRKSIKEDEHMGRGRKKTWSLPWLKKLLVLRMCGLHFSEIFKLLSVLSNGRTPEVERTAQHNMRMLLGEGWKELCASDKATTRRRLKFLVDSEQRRKSHKATKQSSKAPQKGYLSISTTPPTTVSTPEPHYPVTNEELTTLHKQSLQAEAYTPMGINLQSSDDIRSDASIRSSKLSEILRRASYTSSQKSLIKRAVRMRYSLSSCATSSQYSIHEAASIQAEGNSERPETVLDEQRARFLQQNRELLQTCCSVNIWCIHNRISNWISNPKLNQPIYGKLHLDTETVLQQINTPDSSGRNALFFAAGLAAPLEVLRAIIQRTVDLNAVDIYGQTFLYYLDPLGIVGSWCQVSCEADNSSAFECLVRILEFRAFNFEHVDPSNKTFLSWLCTRRGFDATCLWKVMQRNPKWMRRIIKLSSLRDNFGLSFVDYLSRRDRAMLASCISSHSWSLGGLGDSHPIVLPDTTSGLCCSSEEGIGQCPNLFQCYLDVYDEKGRSRIVQLLEDGYALCKDDIEVLEIARRLYYQGANINAPSRDGTTAVIVAAKLSCPETLRFLLKVGLMASSRDDAGFSALDYAMKNFNRSRRSKWPATLTARSIISITRLLDHARPISDDSSVSNPDKITVAMEQSPEPIIPHTGHPMGGSIFEDPLPGISVPLEEWATRSEQSVAILKGLRYM